MSKQPLKKVFSLKKAHSFTQAATKALHKTMRKAGKRDYELEASIKHK